jgi:two-component system response regulator YesN
MINLLLVDDEALSIDALLNGTEWKNLGVDNVFTAMSMKQACKLFKKRQIDIMICDIEMPQNSGLDLLKWVREKKYKTVNIFLTGHADFNYAQKAIELQSMEYLLKPISFDKMSNIVLKAVSKVNELKKDDDIEQLAKKWHLNKPKIVEQFWRDVITNSISSAEENIKNTANDNNISLSSEKTYVLILISSKKEVFKSSTLNLPKWELSLNLNKILYETFSKFISPLIILDNRKAVFVTSISPEDSDAHKNDELKKMVNNFLGNIKKKIGIDFSVTIGAKSYVKDINNQLLELTSFEEDYVLNDNRIAFLAEKAETSFTYNQPDLVLWRKLLMSAELDNLNKLIDKYFENEKKKNNLNSSILNQLQHDYLQIVCSLLEEYDISPDFIFNTDEAEDLFSKATVSVSNIKKWIYYINKKTISYFSAKNDSVDIIKKVQDYIEVNLYNDISRDDIAKEVNFNPEYLSRLYHKETGIHLMKYIQSKKIEKAKYLLAETSYSIGELASKLGYSNFAYFSHLFKNITGYTPNEYRKTIKRS